MGKTIKVGITQGDINGISYEVILKTLKDQRILELCTPIIYGSAKVAAYHRKALDIDNINFHTIRTAKDATQSKLYLINCLDDNIRVELGKSTQQAGEASLKALEAATADLMENKIDVLVTAPINKKNIQSDKFEFAGHTEYLQQRFNSSGSLMFMVNDLLKVGVVAGHIPIKELPDYITTEKVYKKIKLLNQALVQDFGVRKPRIAVMGLNPHAGDEGVIGNEEQTTIIPAMEKAKADNILAIGPYSADGFFGSGTYRKFDGVLAMYHDQGLTPFKLLTTDGGVNFTAGLPIIRTSPAHGTAYEIAGKNEASPQSFRKALYLACDLFRNRSTHKEITSNPLKSYEISSETSDEVE
ncbi:MAG: 4-hydroxythreonine-4-phosphate dehydrogenase PdxA [Bacteroidetes bacterium]|jgi:4-hydroxythreonine-4-phosphate dehydrogenase|nr:4-hydroxythreonine-4-phosphate dehydrogenase PdxA [Bacteroidota bacterium]